MTLRALIVDDEPLSRKRLKMLLADEAGVDVVGEAEDGRSAIAAVRVHAPDLLFLDVQMPGMSGFDVIAELGPSESPAVIFVTAHDKYALRAFEVHAVDYLLKPFDRARLRQAVERARQLAASGGDISRRLAALLTDVMASRPIERLAIKSAGRVYFVRVAEIDWIEAAGHYVTLHAGTQTHLLRETIKSLESRLDPRRFVRIHRSAIVNVDRINEMQASFQGEYVIVLRDGTRLTSSRSCLPRVQELLK